MSDPREAADDRGEPRLSPPIRAALQSFALLSLIVLVVIVLRP